MCELQGWGGAFGCRAWVVTAPPPNKKTHKNNLQPSAGGPARPRCQGSYHKSKVPPSNIGEPQSKTESACHILQQRVTAKLSCTHNRASHKTMVRASLRYNADEV